MLKGSIWRSVTLFSAHRGTCPDSGIAWGCRVCGISSGRHRLDVVLAAKPEALRHLKDVLLVFVRLSFDRYHARKVGRSLHCLFGFGRVPRMSPSCFSQSFAEPRPQSLTCPSVSIQLRTSRTPKLTEV